MVDALRRLKWEMPEEVELFWKNEDMQHYQREAVCNSINASPK
jgi:hypothetical protein